MRRSRRRSAALRTWVSKSEWMRCAVRVPTAPANPHRMTSVRSAEPPARRQRIGTRLGAENVARAADRMEEPGLSTGFQLSPEVRHEDLDGVRGREGVVAPHLLEEALAGDHDALVAHEVLEELELALRQLDLAPRPAPLVGVGGRRRVPDDEGSRAARRGPAQQDPPGGGRAP